MSAPDLQSAPGEPRRAPFAILRFPILPLAHLHLAGTFPWNSSTEETPDVAVALAALEVASPALVDAVSRMADEHSRTRKREDRLKAALARYLSRMSTRATPFGLCAAYCLCPVGQDCQLSIAGDIRVAYRLDARLIGELINQVQGRGRSNLLLQSSMLWSTEEALFEASEASASRSARGLRRDPSVDRVLTFLGVGATRGEIVDQLVQDGSSAEEAEQLLDELLQARVITAGDREVASLAVGDEGNSQWPSALPMPTEVASLVQDLANLSSDGGIGSGLAKYLRSYRQRVETMLGRTVSHPVLHAEARCQSSNASISHELTQHIIEGGDVLVRAGIAEPLPALENFAARFEIRFGDAHVPLLQAVEGERGAGFELRRGADQCVGASHDFGSQRPGGFEFRTRESVLLPLVVRSWNDRAEELILSEEDLQALSPHGGPPLPHSYIVHCRLQSSWDSPRPTPRRTAILRLFGPGSTAWLGRFAVADSELPSKLREMVNREARAREPEILAEIIAQVPGSAANVTFQPRLYSWCIAAAESADDRLGSNILPISDLLIGLEGGRFLLSSRTLGRTVVPRLSTALHPSGFRSAAVQLLALLSRQGCAGHVSWSWGPLGLAPYLPRVRFRDYILAPRRWLLTAAPAANSRVVEDLSRQVREARDQGMPRFVGIVEGDNILTMDLDDSDLLHSGLAGQGTRVELIEVDCDPALAPVRFQARPHGHEILLPVEPVSYPEARPQAPSIVGPTAESTLGRDWIYFRVYCGPASMEKLLTNEIATTIRRLCGRNAIRRWFFVRFADPRWHLRIRCQVDGTDFAPVIAAFEEALERPRRLQEVHDLETAWYRREVRRYGGPKGIELCEILFHLDSEASLKALGSDTTGRTLSLAGRMARLVQALSESLTGALQMVESWRDGRLRLIVGGPEPWGQPKGIQMRLRINELYHRLRKEIGPVVAGHWPVDGRFSPADGEIGKVLAGLIELDHAGVLDAPLWSIGASLAHMSANRTFRHNSNAHEVLALGLLARALRELIERRKVPDLLTSTSIDAE